MPGTENCLTCQCCCCAVVCLPLLSHRQKGTIQRKFCKGGNYYSLQFCKVYPSLLQPDQSPEILSPNLKTRLPDPSSYRGPGWPGCTGSDNTGSRKSKPMQCSKKDIRTTQSIDVKSTRTAFKRLREHQTAQSVANQIKKLKTAGFPEETVAPIVESIVVAFIVESFRHHSLTCLDLCLVMCNLCLICLLRNG